ncbi:hypothetical protein [Cloacibacillus sp. An23]|uniref:hypothetical protein n=1 Tax=Cloacibacillus sp. An23 TaxID=1965591 RepID=UPI001EF4FB9A|nr:hypothetical protein [Cloacibacillus sp. An23]
MNLTGVGFFPRGVFFQSGMRVAIEFYRFVFLGEDYDIGVIGARNRRSRIFHALFLEIGSVQHEPLTRLLLLPVRKQLRAVALRIFQRFFKLFAPRFTFDDKEHIPVFISYADICAPALRVVTEMPFLFKLYVFRAVSFFKKAVHALKHYEVFWRAESVVAFPAFYRVGIIQLFRGKIRAHRYSESGEIFLIQFAVFCEAQKEQQSAEIGFRYHALFPSSFCYISRGNYRAPRLPALCAALAAKYAFAGLCADSFYLCHLFF